MRVVGNFESWMLQRRLAIANRGLLCVCGVLLILAFILFYPGLGPDSSLGHPRAQVVGVAAPTVSVSDSNASALAAQLEQMRQTDERLLQTVHWALGTLSAIAAALVAFSWFTTVRISDRERIQLRQEMEEVITSRANSSEAHISETLKGITEHVSREVSTQLQSIEEQHQEKFNSLEQGIAVTHVELLSTAARSEAAKGNHLGAFDQSLTMIIVGLDANLPSGISRGLALAQTALEQGARPSVDLAAEMNDVLSRVPEKYSTDRDNIRALLSETRRRTTEEGWEEE